MRVSVSVEVADDPAVAEALARGRGARSFPNHLREATGLHGACYEFEAVYFHKGA